MQLFICLAICLAIVTPPAMFGQTAPPPAFEVASIKPSPPSGHLGVLTYPGGRVRFGHSTLEMLITNALDIQKFQISGGPGWIHDERYEIDARVPASSESSKANPSVPNAPMNAEQREMLLRLLMDRFQLKFHHETRQDTVYVLRKGRGALKLTEAKAVSDFPWVGSPHNGDIRGDGIAGLSVSMPVLAERLSFYMGHPVLDGTGLKGFFDFRYDYISDDPRPDVVS